MQIPKQNSNQVAKGVEKDITTGYRHNYHSIITINTILLIRSLYKLLCIVIYIILYIFI